MRLRRSAPAGCSKRFEPAPTESAVYRCLVRAGVIDPRQTTYRHERFVPLLSHAYLPRTRERDKSAEVAVTHQPKVCEPSAEALLRPVSPPCTREKCPRRESNTRPR